MPTSELGPHAPATAPEDGGRSAWRM